MSSSVAFGHYFLIAATVIAVAVIVAVSTWSHGRATGTIYAAGMDVSNFNEEAVHEGVRWAQNAHCEATIWAIVLLVFLVVVLGWSFWHERLGMRQ